MRLGAFIAAFYYFVITVGISLSLHFCNGKLSCFSFIPGNDSFCCHTDEHEEECTSESTVCAENCCSTETVNIALDADFTIKSLEFKEAAILKRTCKLAQIDDSVESTPTLTVSSRGSPPTEVLYLLHSKFIFYG